MKSFLNILIIVALWGFLSCGSDSSPSGPGKPLLKITASDGSQFMPGVRISLWHHLNAPWFGAQKSPAAPAPGTTLAFDLPVACSVSVKAYTMLGALLQPIVDQSYAAGYYTVPWPMGAGAEKMVDGVYKIAMRTFDQSGRVLFRDSIYAVCINENAVGSVMGYTGGNGVFQTDDILRFPNLLPLPTLYGTNLVGTVMGEFVYTDTVTIVLLDTLTYVSITRTEVIKLPSNEFNYAWPPAPPPQAIDDTGSTPGTSVSRASTKPGGGIPDQFELRQNYPNPFY